MRILLFGAAGQLGSEILASSGEQGIAIVGLTRRDVDITDATAVARAIEAEGPSLVVNASAYTAVDQAEKERDLAEAVNGRAPGFMAAACASTGIPLVHFSTDYVFDGTKTGAYVETDPVAPLGAYGESKLAGEEAVRARLAEHLILRTSWVYGFYGRNFLKTILRLANERDALTIVADQRGCPTATRDLAGAIFIAAQQVAQGGANWGTYHLAGQGATTWHGFATAIVAAAQPFTGRSPTVKAITTADYPTPARRPANSELDSSRFAEAFGFRAAPWQQRVEDCVSGLMRGREP
ncbi:dTDP-4-dehydrorhamnose reductase [Chelatococcus sp. GCM10030263]|uniref:dTDP-4-dehydrorhamnose reductase n=1 Tax=Chelatococcus sp. GCM10030263 TaxID=3273387 RepID=UPI00360BD273